MAISTRLWPNVAREQMFFSPASTQRFTLLIEVEFKRRQVYLADSKRMCSCDASLIEQRFWNKNNTKCKITFLKSHCHQQSTVLRETVSQVFKMMLDWLVSLRKVDNMDAITDLFQKLSESLTYEEAQALLKYQGYIEPKTISVDVKDVMLRSYAHLCNVAASLPAPWNAYGSRQVCIAARFSCKLLQCFGPIVKWLQQGISQSGGLNPKQRIRMLQTFICHKQYHEITKCILAMLYSAQREEWQE